MKSRKSPQEKKRKSYKRDRRNAYGESPHGARTSIPENKKRVNEEYRRKIKQVLKENSASDPDQIDDGVKRVKRGDWKKMSDQPLGQIIERKKVRREKNTGRKAKAKVERKKSDDLRAQELDKLKSKLIKQIDSGNKSQVLNAILYATMKFPDWQWPQAACLLLSQKKDPDIRGLAILGLGHIARVHGVLEKDSALATIRRGLKDSEEIVRGQAENAKEDIQKYLGWKI